MVNMFFIFCETKSDSGKAIRYVNDIVCTGDVLQERCVHLHSIGVKVYKVVPILVDVENGEIKIV